MRSLFFPLQGVQCQTGDCSALHVGKMEATFFLEMTECKIQIQIQKYFIDSREKYDFKKGK